jgi:hypothetical protein
VGSTVFSTDLGALGTGECLAGRSQLNAQVRWSLLDSGCNQFAEGGDLGLGQGVTAVAVAGVGEVGVEDVEGFGGLLPWSAGPIAAGGGVLLRHGAFQAGL